MSIVRSTCLKIRRPTTGLEVREAILPPSGSRGLILGDIFGRRAGLTSVELTLFLFLVLRPALGSGRLPLPRARAGLIGEATAPSIGLGLPDCAAPAEGVLIGPNLGVFRADIRGVDSSSLRRMAVSRRGSGGFSSEGSGSIRSSSGGWPSEKSPKLGDCCRRISEAGVAGQTLCPLAWVAWANSAGECDTEPGLGGGPISERFSGETESNSELSVLQCISGRSEERRVGKECPV